MKDNLLKVGDVINLTDGMKVYAMIPEMFVYSNRKTSRELTVDVITIGKIYKNDTNIDKDIDNLISNIINEFNTYGFNILEEDVREFALSKIKQPKAETFILHGGEFVVTKTLLDGGSDYNDRDYYPDGYRVYCQKLIDGSYHEDAIEVNFYQTGCFTAMIEAIKPIRKLKLKFE